MSAKIFPLKDFHDEEYEDMILIIKFPKLAMDSFSEKLRYQGMTSV